MLDSIRIHKEHWDFKLKDIDTMVYKENYYHDYFRELPFLELKKIINLDNQRVLVASCGSGVDIKYLTKNYDNLKCYASDIAEKAVEIVKRTFNIDGSVQNNERLTFEDNMFDYSFIAASLHHLKRPHLGLYELLRVSKKGLIVIEPNDCWLTRLFITFGFATEYEKECKNYVFRYSKNDVKKIAKAMFCDFKVVHLFAIHRVAKNKLDFTLMKYLNRISNMICPYLGNYIIFFISKNID